MSRVSSNPAGVVGNLPQQAPRPNQGNRSSGNAPTGNGGNGKEKSEKKDGDGTAEGEEKKPEAPKPTPWMAPGKVADDVVLRAYLQALLTRARHRHERALVRMALWGATVFLGLVLVLYAFGIYGRIAALIVGALWFAFPVKLGVRALRKWLSIRDAGSFEATRAYLTANGGLVAAALDFVWLEHQAGGAWAQAWAREFELVWGTNPFVTLPGQFVEDAIAYEAEQRTESQETAVAEKVVPTASWSIPSLPSVFAVLRLLIQIAVWALILYFIGLGIGFYTWQGTMGKWLPEPAHRIEHVFDSYFNESEVERGTYLNQSPNGSFGPSDREIERSVYPNGVPGIDMPPASGT